MGSMEISATFQRIILTQLLNAYGGKHVSELLGPSEDGDAGGPGMGTGHIEWTRLGSKNYIFWKKRASEKLFSVWTHPWCDVKGGLLCPWWQKALQPQQALGKKGTFPQSYPRGNLLSPHFLFFFYWNLCIKNLDSILKSRDITLPTKVHIIKAMVFPVVLYGYESWTIKKAGRRKLRLSNCGAGEDSWESLGQQGDQTNQN